MSWLDNLPVEPVNKLLNPIADSLGQGIGSIFYWAFQKPIKFKIIKEVELQDLANKTSARLQNIPETNRDTSKRGLLMKIIEEAQYQISEEDLRTMFANLIAASVDNRKNTSISPRFSFILSQLSAKDAKVLQIIYNQPYHQLPLGYLNYKNKDGSLKISPYLSLTINNEELFTFKESFESLASLGIITIHQDAWLASTEYTARYNLIEQILKNRFYDTRVTDINSLEFKKGSIKVTSFGESFLRCIF